MSRSSRPLTILVLVAGVVATGACAGAEPPVVGPGAPGGEISDTLAAPASPEIGALARVDSVLESGEAGRAAEMADSLYTAWRDTPDLAAEASRALLLEAQALEQVADMEGARATLAELLERADEGDLRVEAVRRIAQVKVALAEEPEAIALLLRTPAAIGGDEVELIRRAANRLSIPELEALSDMPVVAPREPAGDSAAPEREAAAGRDTLGMRPAGAVGPVDESRRANGSLSRARAALFAELARARALAGRGGDARAAARLVLGTEGADDSDRETAQAVLEGEVEPLDRPLRIGAILPLTGRFATVGKQLRDGIRLAFDEYREARGLSEDGARPEAADTAGAVSDTAGGAPDTAGGAPDAAGGAPDPADDVGEDTGVVEVWTAAGRRTMGDAGRERGAADPRDIERGAPALELIVADDGADPAAAAAISERMENRGVVGIIGPIRSEALVQAAEAREYPGLLLVSPTATEIPRTIPHAYSLWERSSRDRAVAEDLGRWMTEELGLRRLAMLYPQGEAGRATYEAFVTGAYLGGGLVVAASAYDPDSTTFAGPIAEIAAHEPEGVFVAAEDPRTVLQLGPQLAFFGLRPAVIAGGPAWSDPEVVRRFDPTFSDYRVVGTFVDRMDDEGAWSDFRALYESRYQRALPEEMFPALGYDAARLILAHLPPGGLPRPGALARAVGEADSISGATGSLDPLPGASVIGRRPLILMFRDRELVPADVDAIRDWAEQAREREERTRELEEAEEEADSP